MSKAQKEGFMYTETRTKIKVSELVDKTIKMITPFQRKSNAWAGNLEHRKSLIRDIVARNYIPAVVLSKQPDGNFFVLDGLQRISTLNLFINQGLMNVFPNATPKEVGIIIENIRNMDISVDILENMVPEEELERFVKLNTNKVQLNAAELRRASHFNNNIMKVLNEDLSGVQTTSEWGKKFYNLLTNGITSKIEKLQERCTDEDIVLMLMAFSKYNPETNIIKGSKNKFLDSFVENSFKDDKYSGTYSVRYELNTIMDKASPVKEIFFNNELNFQLVVRGLAIAIGKFDLNTLKNLRFDIEKVLVKVDKHKFDTLDNRNTEYWNKALTMVYIELDKLQKQPRAFKRSVIEKKLESKVGNALCVED